MCLMFLMCLSVTLVVMSELLLVRCTLASSLACKDRNRALPKAHLKNSTTTNKNDLQNGPSAVLYLDGKPRLRLEYYVVPWARLSQGPCPCLLLTLACVSRVMHHLEGRGGGTEMV